jgi:predicted transcriptional regulator
MSIKIRLSLDLTPEMKRILEELAEREGVNQGEILRRAIALFRVAQKERRAGHEIAVIRNGKVAKRLVWY